jgi:hypothetical protein
MFNNIEFHLSILQIECYSEITKIRMIGFDFWCFNATFNNISTISWRPVLVLEYPKRTTDHGQATGKLYHLRLRVECTLFCNLQIRARTHAALVMGLYELFDPTT